MANTLAGTLPTLPTRARLGAALDEAAAGGGLRRASPQLQELAGLERE